MPDHERSHQGRSFRHQLDIAASADRVWSAWADPQQIAQWFVDRAQGFAKPNEVVKWFFDTMKVEVPQPVLRAEPGKSFVTGGEYGGRAWMLEVLLEHRGGHTTIRLVNSGFAEGSPEADETFSGIASGWEMALHTLKEWLESHATAGGACTHSLVLRPAAPGFGYAACAPAFFSAEGLSRWLGATTCRAVQPGEPITIELEGGERLEGKVLCNTGREVAFSWPAHAAVLSLKAFAAGPAHMLGLDLRGWGPRALSEARFRPLAERALERLASSLAKPGSRT